MVAFPIAPFLTRESRYQLSSLSFFLFLKVYKRELLQMESQELSGRGNSLEGSK